MNNDKETKQRIVSRTPAPESLIQKLKNNRHRIIAGLAAVLIVNGVFVNIQALTNDQIEVTSDNIIPELPPELPYTQPPVTSDNPSKKINNLISNEPIEISVDEYIVIQNEDGSYDLSLSLNGTGNDTVLSAMDTIDLAIDLKDSLQQQGKLKKDAKVDINVLPTAPSQFSKEAGNTISSSRTTNNCYQTMDGHTYYISNNEGKAITNDDIVLREESRQLFSNYIHSLLPVDAPHEGIFSNTKENIASDEYIVVQNEDGSYDLALGGNGLDSTQVNNLKNELKETGKVTENAEIHAYILGSISPEEMKQGITKRTISENHNYQTMDGQNYYISNKDGSDITNSDVVYKGESTALNYNAKTPANDLIQSGDPVYTNAADAISETNKKEANQWFNDDPLDVYNTATQQFMHLSPQQLNDMDYLTSLAQDPNNVMLFGKDFNNPSGYVALNDIINGMLNTNERGKNL